MQKSRELMKQAKIIPKLRLGNKTQKGTISTGPHRVKILEDKITKGSDPISGKEIEIVRYTVEENGEKKKYDVPVKNKDGELHYLVQRLSEIPEGGEVILEMKKAGMKNYISVIPVEGENTIQVEEELGDIDMLP